MCVLEIRCNWKVGDRLEWGWYIYIYIYIWEKEERGREEELYCVVRRGELVVSEGDH